VAKLPKIKWVKHTSFHWQTKVHGDLLDYWPTKNKWRFRGETHQGGWPRAHDRAVREFITSIPALPSASGKCAQCCHWLRGIGQPNDQDTYGQCKIKCLDLSDDEVAYTAEDETCEHFEVTF